MHKKKQSKKKHKKNFLSFQSCPLFFLLNPGTPFPLKPCTILPVLGIRGDPTCEMVCRIMCARLGWLWRHAKHAICKDRPKDILTDEGSATTNPPPGKQTKKKRLGQKKSMVLCVCVCLFVWTISEIEMLVWVCSCDY